MARISPYTRAMFQKQEAEAELSELKSGLIELKRYLLSSKFWEDTTVQTNDVLHRLEEIESHAFRYRTRIENINHEKMEEARMKQT